jgi:thiol-disulfide isomerase/thioredoxin
MLSVASRVCALVACDQPPPRRRARPPTSTVASNAPPEPASAKPAAKPAPKPQPEPVEAEPKVEGVSPIEGSALLAQIRKSGMRGALVNVWASWCGSCRREIPMLLELRKAFVPQGLDVLFVSADVPDKWPDAVTFAREATLPLPAFVVDGSMGLFKRAMSPKWRGAIPASFLFDGEAKLRHTWEGPVYEHEVAPILQGFLAGEDIDGETRPPLSAGRTTP